jgi:DNA-directed RNA polymerase specialized sigma subunit
VLDNMAYAEKGARKYAWRAGSRTDLGVLLYDDFLSAAYFGLVQAALRYRPGRATFRTYSFPWIDKYLKHTEQDQLRSVGFRWHHEGTRQIGLIRVARQVEWPTDSKNRVRDFPDDPKHRIGA